MRPTFLAAVLILAASPALAADCKAEFEAAFALLRETPYVASAETREPDGSRSQITVKVAPHTGLEAHATVTGLTMHMIAIGDRGWVNSGDGWEEMSVQVVRFILGEMPYDENILASAATDITCLDHHFEFTAGPIRASLVTDGETGLPVEIRQLEPADGTIISYTYGEEIVITPPM